MVDLTRLAEPASQLAIPSGTSAVNEFLVGVKPDFVPAWAVPITAAVVAVAICFVIISVNALFCIWFERKVSGHIQCRYGPMYVGGWHGWAQASSPGLRPWPSRMRTRTADSGCTASSR